MRSNTQSFLPVSGSTYSCRKKRTLLVLFSWSMEAGYWPILR